MLFLQFKLGNDRYALDPARVVEIVPLLSINKLAGTSAGVAGVCNYRGQFVTVIDLCEVMLQRPHESYLSTRIIIVKHSAQDGGVNLMGLIAEEVMGTLRKDRTEFANPPAGASGTPIPLPVFFDTQGAIHLLDESRLLSDILRSQLAHGTH